MTEIETRFAAMQDVARDAGAYALDYFRSQSRLKIDRKGLQDVVSQADRETEQLITKAILEQFPDDGLLGEEHGEIVGSNEYLWVVDPIDGTACFVTGIPDWCVSIGLVANGKIVAGAIFHPTADEMFAGHPGAGATLNGNPISVSSSHSIKDGMLGFGFSHRTNTSSISEFLEPFLTEGGMLFRNGSGALMLAYVAAGRLIGYYEAHINSWDCAAGIAIVQAAGGWTNNFLAGDGLTSGNPILAGTPANEIELRRLTGINW
jgi:myo-inositol-1(or 4)-monophosphatase